MGAGAIRETEGDRAPVHPLDLVGVKGLAEIGSLDTSIGISTDSAPSCAAAGRGSVRARATMNKAAGNHASRPGLLSRFVIEQFIFGSFNEPSGEPVHFQPGYFA